MLTRSHRSIYTTDDFYNFLLLLQKLNVVCGQFLTSKPKQKVFCENILLQPYTAVICHLLNRHVAMNNHSKTSGQSDFRKAAPNDPVHTARAAELSRVTDRLTDRHRDHH